MKKTVSFSKDLEFTTMIGEIVEISLEDNLKFVDNSSIEGSFFITGKYKMTEASRLEEDFSFNIPVEITLTQSLEIETSNINISDFVYEIVDENILRCSIDVLIEGIEIVDLNDNVEELDSIDEEKNRECDGDKEEKEIEIPFKERDSNPDVMQDIATLPKLPKEENVNNIDIPLLKENTGDTEITNSLFSNLADEDDSFSSYYIYIVRENDSIEKVLEKYKITKEKLEEYNDLSNITLNSKIIVPSVLDEKN